MLNHISGLLLGLAIFIGMFFMVADRSPDFNAMVDSNVVVDNGCSGTYIGDGLVLSAAHCFQGRDLGKDVRLRQIRTGLNWKEVTTMTGQLEWKDEKIDLALVRVPDGSIFTAATVCRREAKLGETVYAMGNPAMQEDSLLKGIVSKVVRKITIAGTERNYFQVDAGLVQGISGGALYDSTGCLIGVNAAGIPGTVIGGVVPIALLPREN